MMAKIDFNIFITLQLLLLSLLLMCMQGCESSLTGELNVAYEGDQLTVSGFISPDSIWIQAGKTVNGYQPFSISDFIVPGIQVFLIDDNGNETALTTTLDGFNFKEKRFHLYAGVPYKILVKAPGFDDVISKSVIIPAPVIVQGITYSDIAGIGNGPATSIHIAFTDTGEEDYYFIGFGVKKDTLSQPAINWVIDDLINEKCYNVGTFSDYCFANQTTNLLFGMDKNYYFGNSSVREAGDSIIVRFGKVSEALFKAEQSQPTDDGFIEGINEPPVTYSNVSNGHGVVFGQNWKEYFFKIN